MKRACCISAKRNQFFGGNMSCSLAEADILKLNLEPMERIGATLSDLRKQVRQHPVGKLKLSREALEKFALAQYRDSRVWAGWFVTMRDLATNLVLKAALQHSLEGEIGDLGRNSHMTLCLDFIRSLGLEPSSALSDGNPGIGSFAEGIINLIPNMNQAQICGWVVGTEDLVPSLFELFLPHFERLGGVNTRYLTEHIQVDAEDHAVQMRRGCESILASDPECIGDVQFGIELAGRFTLSVPDELLAAYASSSTRDHQPTGGWEPAGY